MKAYKRLGIVFVFLLVFLAFTNVDSAVTKGDQKPGKSAHVPDVLIIEVMPSITLENDPGGGANHKFSTNSPALDEALSSIGVQSLKPLFPPGQLKKEMPANLSHIYRLKLKPNTDVEAAVTTLSSIPDIVFAEPDYIAVSTELPSSVKILTINDPEYPTNQWGMSKINIENAWDDTYGSPTVTIAVIDSGIDLTHVDLAAHLWLNPGEIAGNGQDDDSNGYIDDVRGWNILASSNDISDSTGHGTLVAGVAAAIGWNAQGIVGVCPLCRIMPVKVTDTTTANYSDIATGVLYAAKKGAEVINISLGGYSNSNMLRNAIDTAVNTYGAVIVAGAGNDNLSTPFYPAYYSNVLAVAGTASDDTKVGTSNYGAWVDVSAPGINIRTTALGGGWADNSGTSFASPFAAGLAGLIRSLHPDWNQATVRSQIVYTADGIESVNPTYAGLLGSGRLNAGTAMQALQPLLSITGYNVNGLVNGHPVLGATAQMTVTLSNDRRNATGVTATLTTTDTANVTIIQGSASYGDIPIGTAKTNSSPFTFSVSLVAGTNHPIPFKLHINDSSGYSTEIDFTVTTESGVVDTHGTIGADTTWTNNKTYLITADVSVAPGFTLTIQPGTTIKFNGNFMLNVYGTLIADGTAEQPIRFNSNTTGTWDKILFSDTSTDATADASGTYISGSILRYVNIEGATSGITCTTSTPYLSNLSINSGGLNCSLGTTGLWLIDNAITGNGTITGPANAFHNTVTGGLSISGAGIAEDNAVSGTLSLGSGSARRNNVGGLSIGGSGGTLENNTVSNGSISLGNAFNVTGNTISGSLSVGDGAAVDHNTVSYGIVVGSSSTVTWNNVENASGTGLAAGSNVTAQYNRLVRNGTGMIASTGLIEHNLIANNKGVGLQVSGNATISNNTLTGNQGNSIVILSGAPVIQGNNLELNTGTYDIQNNGSSLIDASGNWWGTTDGATIDVRIFDYWDDLFKGTVTYQPVLTDPDQNAPAYARNATVLPDTVLGIQTGTFEIQFSKPMDTNNFPAMQFYKHNVTTNDGWLHYDTTNSVLPNNDVRAIAIEANGTKWFGTRGGGVASFDGTNWTIYNTSNSGLPDNNVLTIAIEGNGTKWFGTGDGGIASFDGTNWRLYNTSNSGLPDNYVLTIAIEGNGTKWFGTGYEGIASFDGTNWRVYNTSNSGLPAFGIYKIAIDGNGIKWIGTDWGGVASFDGTHWIVYKTSNSGLPSDQVLSIAFEADGTKWFGTYAGVASFMGNQWTVYNTANSELPHNKVESIAIENGSTKLFGTWGGVTSFDGTSWTTKNTSNSGLPGNNVWKIVIGDDGTKWFGTDGGVGVLYDDVKTYPIVDNKSWQSSNQYRATYDITSAIPKGDYFINVSNAVDLDGMKIAPIANTTFTVDYAGTITDKTPPTKPVVTAYTSNGNLTSLSASWTSSDAQSPITQYRYAIGTTPGGRDVVDWTYTDNTSMTHTGLSLTAGITYYVSAAARNEGGLWSLSGISNGVKDGIATATFLSTGAQDGWILESTEASSKGGTMNATATTFQIGDDASDKQYRSILSFNTAILPNTAVITRVTLKFKGHSVTGVNPFTTHGNLLVDVYKGAFSASPSLQLTDFQALPSKASIGIIPKTPVSGWYTKIWTSGIFPYINKLTVTQFRLRFTKDDNDDGNADILKFFSGNYATASARPTLIVEYYVP